MNDALIIRWPGGERRFEAGGEILLGRDPQCHVVLENPNVSRVHAAIRHDERGWVLRDHGSAQGTFRDDQAVTEAFIEAPTRFVLGAPRVGMPIEVFTEASSEHETRHRPAGSSDDDQRTEIPNVARPGGELRSELFEDATVVASGSLRVECAGKSYAFDPGRPTLIGRDRDADIVSVNPTVSRRHAVLEHDDQGWRIEDLGSRGGVYVDGRPVKTHRISGSVAVWLGDPDAGERLVLVTGGQRTVSATDRFRRMSRSGSFGVAAVILGVVAIGVAAWAIVSAPWSSGSDLDRLARAVVSISTSEGMIGSGAIIDAEQGLILTNAHVVAPRALGRGVVTRMTEGALPEDPREITISVSDGIDKAAEPRFRAELAAVDGYLDLAVLRISTTLTGALIEPRDLTVLQAVPIGSSDGLTSGDPIRILGYPAVAQSNAATLTEGVIAGIVPDARLASNRAYFNLDATLRPGNSGGLAADSRGRIIGTPTLNWIGGATTPVGAMRPIGFAIPLLDAVRKGEVYETPYITNLTGEEEIVNLRFGAASSPGFRSSCGFAGPLPRLGDVSVALLIDYTGFDQGVHHDVLIQTWDDTAGSYIGNASTADVWPFRFNANGCFTVVIDLDGPIVPGDYFVDLFLGPNYRPVDGVYQFNIDEP